jgi:methylated-DNA-protein-cysteine methyltransferase-like protein
MGTPPPAFRNRHRDTPQSRVERVAETGQARRGRADVNGRRGRADEVHVGRDQRASAILAVVSRIPRGKVTTYGSVAARAGFVRQARLVGKVLSGLPVGSRVPWHRVVAAGGRIAFPAGSVARARQLEKLAREGIEASRAGRVDLKRHGWSAAGERDLDRWLWGRVDE